MGAPAARPATRAMHLGHQYGACAVPADGRQKSRCIAVRTRFPHRAGGFGLSVSAPTRGHQVGARQRFGDPKVVGFAARAGPAGHRYSSRRTAADDPQRHRPSTCSRPPPSMVAQAAAELPRLRRKEKFVVGVSVASAPTPRAPHGPVERLDGDPGERSSRTRAQL